MSDILFNSQIEKKSLQVQQETNKDYDSKFVLLSKEIDELTKAFYKNTPDNTKIKEGGCSQTVTLSKELLNTSKRSNKANKHHTPYQVPKKDFEYVESSRCKHERAKMIGETCSCCEKFYKDELQSMTSKERIQQNSRHRSKYKRPKTPPGFWDMDFPF